jgi:DNA-binding transcriptional ArsR family regulator
VSSAPKHDVFQAIADPTRRKLLRLLSDKEEMNLTGLSKHFPMSRPAVSKHLRILSDAGLVSERKVGRETRYRLQPEALLELKRWLSHFEQYWENKMAALKHYVENEGANDISPVGPERNEQEPKE